MKRGFDSGFTLVEMIVALGIFGMLSAGAVTLLSFSVKAQEIADERLGDVGEMRRLGAILTSDLGQAAPRRNRDEAGQMGPAFSGDAHSLALVRRGWENPGAAPRSSLQRVEYRLAGSRLERIAYPRVDGAAPMAPAAMAENVRAVRFRYRDGDGQWRERWDPARIAELPAAVELTVEMEGRGMLRQLFLAGAGEGR